MFRISKQASVAFNSQGLAEKGKRISTGTQTDARTSEDKEVQSLTSKDESIQANLERCLSTGRASFNSNKLMRFLNDASALTIRELEESLAIEENLRHIDLMSKDDEELTCHFYYSSKKSNNLSSGDDGVRRLRNEVGNENVRRVRNGEDAVKPLRNGDDSGKPPANDQNSKEPKLSIEHLTFSCNLNQLILAYSVREHSYWCTHKSSIEFCNLYQTSEKKPNLLKTIFQVEVKHCVTVLASHPTQFGQVAVGTKAGSILVIDRELATGSRLSAAGDSSCVRHESNLHKLEITFLSFKKSLESDYHPVTGAAGSMQATSSRGQTGTEGPAQFDELISCSLDGKIILWKIKPLERQLQPVKVFSLGRQQLLKQVQPGIRCAALSPEQGSLLIGCENALLSTAIHKRTAATGELEVEFEYEPHKGEIVSIEFPPGATSRFLTNGKDNEIRLYELNLRKPLLTIYLDENHSNYKWMNDGSGERHTSATPDESASEARRPRSAAQMIGLHESNLYMMKVYKKDANYFTASQCYPLRHPFRKLFLSRSNQLALVNEDEIRVFDLNVLMR